MSKLVHGVKITQIPSLLHKIKVNIFDERYKNILMDLIQADDKTDELIKTMNTLD
jgi:hypothetical protein